METQDTNASQTATQQDSLTLGAINGGCVTDDADGP